MKKINTRIVMNVAMRWAMQMYAEVVARLEKRTKPTNNQGAQMRYILVYPQTRRICTATEEAI